MPIASFSGSAISLTYQRLVQTDGTLFADGTGSLLSITAASSSTAISSSYSNYAVTASHLDTYLSPFPFTGSAEITGSLNVIGPFSASSALVTGNVVVLGTASINTLVVNQTQLSTGSNQLGDAANDTQTLYGTVRIPTGSLSISGSLLVSSSAIINTLTIGRGGGNEETNTAVGYNALINNTIPYYGAGFRNTAFGYSTLSSNTIGSYNTVVGRSAGAANTEGSNNTFIGDGAGEQNILGNSNVYIGNGSGGNQTTSQNTYVGGAAGYSAVAGTGYSTYIGYLAGHATTGGDNVFLGNRAGFGSIKSNWFILGNRNNAGLIEGNFSTGNVLIGTSNDDGFKLNVYGSGRFTSNLTVTGSVLVTGSITSSQDIQVNNINIGRGGTSGSSTTGYNIAIGNDNFSTSSFSLNYRNVALGISSLRSLTNGSDNIAIGSAALRANQTPSFNVAIGSDSMLVNTGGEYNVAVGYRSLTSNTNGTANVAVGWEALRDNLVGNSNVGVGNAALQGNRHGRRNVAIGDGTLGILSAATSSNNTGLGYSAGVSLRSGSYNTFIGSDNDPIISGSSNTFVGSRIALNALGTGLLNNTVALADGSGSIRLFSPSNGNVIIGDTTDLGYRLQVSGSGNFNGNLTATGSLISGVGVIGRGFGKTFDTQSSNTGLTVTGDLVVAHTEFLSKMTFGYLNSTKYLEIGTDGGGPYFNGTTVLTVRFTAGGSGLYVTTNGYSYFNNSLAINTSANSSYALNVNGNSNITGNLIITGSATNSLLVRGSGATSATTALRVENSAQTARLTILNDGTSAFNTSQLFVSSSGNTGVSTSSPRVRLQVGDKVIDDNGYTYDSGSAMIIHPTQTSATVLNDPKEVLVLARQGLAGQAFGAAAALEISRYENPGTNSRTRLDFKLAHDSFIGFSTRVMTMLSNGNVGIGNTSPTQGKLVIAAPDESVMSAISIRQSNDSTYGMDFGLDQTINGHGYFYSVAGNNKYEFLQFKRTNIPDVYLVNTGGNVGIGNTSPGFKLDVSGTGRFSGNVQITGSATNSLLVKGSGTTSATTALRIENSAATPRLTILDDGTSAFNTSQLFISSSGNIGFGTTSSIARIHTNGDILVQNTNLFPRISIRGAYPGLQFFSDDASMQYGSITTIQEYGTNPFGNLAITSRTGLYIYIQSFSSSVPAMSFLGGNIQIGNNADFGYKLDVNGAGNFRGNTTVTGSLTVLVGSSIEFQVNQTGVKIGNASTDSHQITGSVSISSSFTTSGSALTVYKSGSTTLDIQGSQGQLFSVVDSLSGSLMSVNDVSGLPILEVFSDDRVVMGTYGAPAMVISGSNTVTSGSLRGRVVTVPTASGTASMDCSQGNFFSLTLSGSSTLHLSASNIQPGQTINLRVTQPATSGSLSYGSIFKFAGGIPYTASSTGSTADIISFISFDTTTLYGSAIKNLF